MGSARQTRKMGRRAAGFLGGLLATILLVAAPAAAAFVEPINLSNSSAVSGRPAIAVNGAGQVFAVWEEGTEIYFTRSQPGQASCGGLKFEAPRPLSAGTGTASNPAVAANDSNGVFVVWQASSDVWFSRSTDNGETFASRENLSNDATPSNSPTVAADNGGVFVAWSDGSAPAEIVFKRSLNSGVGFEAATKVSRTSLLRTSQAPALAVGGGNVFLAWEERFGLAFLGSAVRYKKFGRSDALTTVAGLGSVDLSAPLFRATSPSLAFGDNGLSLAFVSFSAAYHRSSADGTNFSALEPSFSGLVESPSRAPAARGNGTLMVAWGETLAGNSEIRYRLGTMASPQAVWPTPAPSTNPAAAIDSTGRLLVAWQETVNGNQEIVLSYDGKTGGTPIPATALVKPNVVDLRHLAQGRAREHDRQGPGSGRITVFVELLNGKAGEIDLSTLLLNGYPVLMAPGEPDEDGDDDVAKLGDKNHNGIPDLKVKFSRSAFEASLANAQGDGTYSYSITGQTTSGGCFAGTGTVQIRR